MKMEFEKPRQHWVWRFIKELPRTLLEISIWGGVLDVVEFLIWLVLASVRAAFFLVRLLHL